MTCRKADELMQEALNGEVDEEHAQGLREHLSDCERCADAWHAIWQVRSMLAECDPPDPGEAYLEDATARVMERIAAAQTQKTAADGPPIISSMRYGPLSVKGAGAVFVFAVGMFLGSFMSGSGETAHVGVGDAGWRPARSCHPSVDEEWALRGAQGRYCVHDHHDACPSLALANARTGMSEKPAQVATDDRPLKGWAAPPPIFCTPQPVACR